MPRPNPAESKRLARMIQSGQLIPVLNRTKWAELRTEMLGASAEQSPRFRVRGVFSPEGFRADWEGEFYYHLHPVDVIEWIELKAASDEWLRTALRRHSIPFSIESGVVRVWGYTRPGKQPTWS
ncbi:DUF6678 family protein [Ottowia thiooxydans]|uniref:DUF6678 family protein n=1 Tax=Ottowia thiooxydans TaxID=219182 RepID=UPI001B7F8592|nr:DUF6678 family protein [Ottowia thiooxydans]